MRFSTLVGLAAIAVGVNAQSMPTITTKGVLLLLLSIDGRVVFIHTKMSCLIGSYFFTSTGSRWNVKGMLATSVTISKWA